MANRDKPLMEMTAGEFEKTFDSIGGGINQCILDDARALSPEEALIVVVVIAVLTTPDGVRRVAHNNPEYGDGEGLRSMQDFVAECERGGLLRPGETLSVELREASIDSLARVVVTGRT